MSETASELTTQQLDKLREVFKKQAKAEDEIDKYSRKVFKPVFDERRQLVKTIPHFWPQVISGSGVFEDILTADDQELLEHLKDFHVEHGEDGDKKFFTIHMEFEDNDKLADLKLTKKFTLKEKEPESKEPETDDALEALQPDEEWTSEAVDIKWKKQPSEEGEPSFFDWFKYTGKDDEEELPLGPFTADIGPLLATDMFNNAVNYFIASMQPDIDDYDDVESDEDEDDEEEVEPPKKKSKN